MPDPFRFPDDFARRPTAMRGTKTLDGRVYNFYWRPSARANDGKGAWYVEIANVLGVTSVVKKLTLSTDLVGAYRDTDTTGGIPPGRLVVRRTDGLSGDPRPPNRVEAGAGTLVATIGSPLLVIEYVTVAEDAAAA